jgi:predicted S18 family serine protease
VNKEELISLRYLLQSGIITKGIEGFVERIEKSGSEIKDRLKNEIADTLMTRNNTEKTQNCQLIKSIIDSISDDKYYTINSKIATKLGF